MSRIQIILGDITKLKVDAIVNAANKSLLSGGGVDGAIHRAAGPDLLKECSELGGCPTGEARITKSYNLGDNGVGWIIHAVGPRWLGGCKDEGKLLESAYRSSLDMAINYRDIYYKQSMMILEKYIAHLPEEKKQEVRNQLSEEINLYIEQNPIKTIAFPSISTGIYGYPLDEATDIALRCLQDFLNTNTEIEKIIITCFNRNTYECYINRMSLEKN